MFDIVRFLAAAAALNANPGLAFDTVWASTPSPTQLPEAKQALQRLSSQGGLPAAAVSRAMATASPALQQHFLQCVRQLADQLGDIGSVVDLYTLAQTTVQRAATPALQAYATAAGTRGTPNDVSTLLQRSKLRSGGGGSGNGSCSATASTSGGCSAITAVAIVAILAAIALAIAVGLGWSRLKKAQAQLQGRPQGSSLTAGVQGGRYRQSQGQGQGHVSATNTWDSYGHYGSGRGGSDTMAQFPQQPAFAPLLPSSSMDMPEGFGM
jgi:preprotein translocase subunit SecG